MPAYRKAQPVDAVQLPWAITIHVEGERPKPFAAGTWAVRNRTGGKVYLLPDSEFRRLYVPEDDLAAKAMTAAESAKEKL